MYRYLVRPLVAVLTFFLGSAVPSLFHGSTALKAPPAKSSHCWSRLVASPMMSIENQPNQPLRLRYSSSTIDSADANKREVHFVVENTGDQDITAYTVSYDSKSSGTNGGGGMVTVHPDSRNEILRIGESQILTINVDAGEALSVRVGSVEFVDGSKWNNAQLLK